MFSARELFDIAIRIEENGERLYWEALAYISDKSLRDTLIWLAEQEKHHRNRFIEMKNSITSGSGDLLTDHIGAAILREAVEHHALSLEDVDFKSLQNEQELMKSAIEFEKDGVTFYEIMRSFVTEVDKLKAIDEIIKEEQKHVTFFVERQKAMKING